MSDKLIRIHELRSDDLPNIEADYRRFNSNPTLYITGGSRHSQTSLYQGLQKGAYFYYCTLPCVPLAFCSDTGSDYRLNPEAFTHMPSNALQEL